MPAHFPVNSRPQFTIITSTLNSGATLERCLLSVESQTSVSLEHLIADGQSQDNTLAIVERFAERYPVRLACSSSDTGLYQAWNRGINKAFGQWILFLGSDDFLVADDVLYSVSQALCARPAFEELSFLYGDIISSQARPDWANYKPRPFFNRLRGVTEFPTSVFINSRIFAQGHRFDETYRICADHKFFSQHHLFARGCYLPIPIISFQDGGISSNPSFNRKHYLERRRMLAELGRSRPLFTEWYYWLRSFQ